MLSKKLVPDEGVGPESQQIAKETNKKRMEGLKLASLIAGGILLLLVASFVLVPYLKTIDSNTFSGVGSTTESSTTAIQEANALPASFEATDGKGSVIEENGVTSSDEMTITGYSDGSFNSGLSCLVDSSYYIYCSGSNPVVLSGLPPGEHTFTVEQPHSDALTGSSFGWVILE